jgi:hypothetical protein
MDLMKLGPGMFKSVQIIAMFISGQVTAMMTTRNVKLVGVFGSFFEAYNLL